MRRSWMCAGIVFHTEPGAKVVIPATIEEVHFLGSVIRVRARVMDTMVALDTFNRPDQPPPSIGSTAEISFSPRDVILLP